MWNYAEANLFNVGNSIVCLFYKRKKWSASENIRGKKLKPTWTNHREILFWQLSEPLWTNIVESPPIKRTKINTAANLQLLFSPYISAAWVQLHMCKSVGWLMTNSTIVNEVACRLWGLEAAHKTLRQYWPHGFIALFDSQYQTDYKKNSFTHFYFNILL